MDKISFRKRIDFFIKNKKLAVISVFLLLIFIYMSTFVTPKIYISTKIQDVTEKDYALFVRSSKVSLEKKTRDNCRFISVGIKAVNPPLLIRNVNIKKATLKEYLVETQYFSKATNGLEHLGSYYSNGNNQFFDGIDVYLDGMTDEKLIDIFDDYKIEVTWANFFTGQNKKIYYLKDYFHKLN